METGKMAKMVYEDGGSALGLRTRVFREAASGGIEWMFAVDYVSGDGRWYGFGARPDAQTIADLIDSGMKLKPYKESAPA